MEATGPWKQRFHTGEGAPDDCNEGFLGERCEQACGAPQSDWMRMVGGSRRDSQINTENSNNEKR